MELADFERLADDFQRFADRYAPLFGVWVAQEHGEQYLRGLLLGQTERRNAENLAERVGGASPRSLQRFLTDAPWPTERVIERLQTDVAALLEHPDGVWVVDETGFAKQGTKSAGVSRQYSGTLGQVGNCQVGVFLGYSSDRGQALVDGRLYLPERWTDDRERCRAAGIPDEVPFQTKPEIALAMLRAARKRGELQARWVTGDAVYGNTPAFRDALAADGYWSVLAVPSSLLVRPVRANAEPPVVLKNGWRLRSDLRPVQSVAEVAAGLAPDCWQLLRVAEGAQGPRVYQFARLRVREVRGGSIKAEQELVFRRNPDGSELQHYLATTPPGLALVVLGRVASARWSIETGFEQAKGEVGLDEYEVRSWAGWHHHITLALLANLFLLTVRQDWGGKSAPVDDPPGEPHPARIAATAALEPGRPARLATTDPEAQRYRQALARQAAPA